MLNVCVVSLYNRCGERKVVQARIYEPRVQRELNGAPAADIGHRIVLSDKSNSTLLL